MYYMCVYACTCVCLCVFHWMHNNKLKRHSWVRAQKNQYACLCMCVCVCEQRALNQERGERERVSASCRATATSYQILLNGELLWLLFVFWDKWKKVKGVGMHKQQKKKRQKGNEKTETETELSNCLIVKTSVCSHNLCTRTHTLSHAFCTICDYKFNCSLCVILFWLDNLPPAAEAAQDVRKGTLCVCYARIAFISVYIL